jgi:hypothetical protein
VLVRRLFLYPIASRWFNRQRFYNHADGNPPIERAHVSDSGDRFGYRAGAQPNRASIHPFLLYGVGLGGGWVLQELVWANYFGRVSLGMVRGLGILVTHAFGAAGAPFFGLVHDLTGSYRSSFLTFVIALLLSA